MNNQKILEHFARYIETQLGIVYGEANFFQLEHRLQDIVGHLKLQDLDELYQRSLSGIDGKMKGLILDLATNNETSFFRDPPIFNAFSKLVVPTVCADPEKKNLAIWSAASSAGQEAYSIVMELGKIRSSRALPPLQMLVSDVSETILDRARTGVYSDLEIQRGLSPAAAEENFERLEDGRWRAKPALQSGLQFRKINLLLDWSDVETFDVIFLRNVLIYQSVENKKKVLEKIVRHLRPGGYLVLGAAESLFGLSERFRSQSYEGAIVHQKITDNEDT